MDVEEIRKQAYQFISNLTKMHGCYEELVNNVTHGLGVIMAALIRQRGIQSVIEETLVVMIQEKEYLYPDQREALIPVLATFRGFFEKQTQKTKEKL